MKNFGFMIEGVPVDVGKFVAVFNDGSGADLFEWTEGGVLICAEGQEVDEAVLDDFMFWYKLPEGYQFWYELS